MMIKSSTNENGEATISILNLMKLVATPLSNTTRPDLSLRESDMSRFRGQISSATFIANGHRYTQGSIEGVHLLQYKCVPWQHLRDFQQSRNEALQHQHHAELILHPSTMGPGLDDDQEVSRLVIHGER